MEALHCAVSNRKSVSTDAAVTVLHVLSLQTLYDRLEARGYADKKLQENMECEIMQVNESLSTSQK
jgi:broad-specificity NMP kinase